MLRFIAVLVYASLEEIDPKNIVLEFNATKLVAATFTYRHDRNASSAFVQTNCLNLNDTSELQSQNIYVHTDEDITCIIRLEKNGGQSMLNASISDEIHGVDAEFAMDIGPSGKAYRRWIFTEPSENVHMDEHDYIDLPVMHKSMAARMHAMHYYHEFKCKFPIVHTMRLGVVFDEGFSRPFSAWGETWSGGKESVKKYAELYFDFVSVPYLKQFGFKLEPRILVFHNDPSITHYDGPSEWARCSSEKDASAALNDFSKWHVSVFPDKCAGWQLLVACSMNSNTAGVAFLGTMGLRGSLASGLSRAIDTLTMSAGVVTMHELGHNLNARHTFEIGLGEVGKTKNGLMDYYNDGIWGNDFGGNNTRSFHSKHVNNMCVLLASILPNLTYWPSNLRPREEIWADIVVECVGTLGADCGVVCPIGNPCTACESGQTLHSGACNAQNQCVSPKTKASTRCVPQAARTTEACDDFTLEGGIEWKDRDGDACAIYAARSYLCAIYGDGYQRDNYTANVACCVCEGGSRRTIPLTTTTTVPAYTGNLSVGISFQMEALLSQDEMQAAVEPLSYNLGISSPSGIIRIRHSFRAHFRTQMIIDMLERSGGYSYDAQFSQLTQTDIDRVKQNSEVPAAIENAVKIVTKRDVTATEVKVDKMESPNETNLLMLVLIGSVTGVFITGGCFLLFCLCR